MKYSYYIDSESRILSVCPDDLTGTSDWYWLELGLTPDSVLTDDHGAALYKYEGYEVVERSLEERMADWPPEMPDAESDEATDADYAEQLSRLGVIV